MSPKKQDGEYQALRQRADAVRDRLLDTIERLDRKRHDLFDVGAQLRRHRGALALATFALGLVAAVSVMGWRRAGQRHLWRARRRALFRVWRRPDRVARFQERSFGAELTRRVLLAVIGFGLRELGKEQVRRALPAARHRP